MYEQRHIPGARWVRYDGVTADVLPSDRSAALVFYCANPSCSASPHAAETAIALGWTNVYVMPDGIFGWVEAGLPVEPG
jgi:rhodanese-related sulfurtransferase